MLNKVIIDVVSAVNAQSGLTILTASDEQLVKIQQQIAEALTSEPVPIPAPMDTEMQTARKYFFEKEGYMESDIKCWQYYKEHGDD